MSALEQLDEFELLQQVLRVVPGALAEFQHRYAGLIYSCTRRVLRRYHASHIEDDVEDLVGDLWLRLLDNDMLRLRCFDAGRGIKVSTWLGLLTTNYVIDSLRRRRKYDSLDSIPEPTTAESPQTELERREEALVATRALQLLTRQERLFFLACYHEERDTTELAAELGVSPNTIYSRKFKLRAKLSRLVNELCEPKGRTIRRQRHDMTTGWAAA